MDRNRSFFLAIAASAFLASVLAASPVGAAPASEKVPGVIRVPSFEYGSLTGVAVVSRDNVWAVGVTRTGANGVIAHWNGTRWSHRKVGPVPTQIAAISASDIWAVSIGAILHFNGHSWNVAKYPNIDFYSLAAFSHDSVWAAGNYNPGPYVPIAMLHWTGKKWNVVPVASPEGTRLATITGLAAPGPKSAWAIGQKFNSVENTLLRWDGSVWRASSYPVKATPQLDFINVSSAPHGTAWVVGVKGPQPGYPLSMYWDGKAWHNVPVKTGNGNALNDSCFAPDGTGWAMATRFPYIMHWTGKKWVSAKIVGVSSADSIWLTSCSAISDSDAWAVGSTGNDAMLALHWDGKTWSATKSQP